MIHYGLVTENAFSAAKNKASDVYSYGVVLLELITRKKPSDASFTEVGSITAWVRSGWNETGEIDSIVDPMLVEELLDSDRREQIKKVILLALRCTEKDPNKRPIMIDVLNHLIDSKINQSRVFLD